MKINKLLILLSFLLCQLLARNHPELTWKTLETEHFLVHFHNGTDRTAYEVIDIAEFIYIPVTSMYNFKPKGKTHIIIKDTDDFSNGSAFFFDNKIEIWANPLDFDLRGSHRWIQNVITHEFVHIIQLGASLKYSRHFPALYIQSMEYEDEKRKDVLYGYPNEVVSYAIPSVSVPPWFAEGVAQNMYKNANYDFWDTHRDMILRDAFINNTVFGINEMSSFGKTGIGNEQIYNQGFSIAQYLDNRFGPNVLKDISNEISNPFEYSFSSAIKKVTGYEFEDIYNDWYSDLSSRYNDLLLSNRHNGEIILDDALRSIHPVWSPDGTKFAYLSNKDNDYFGQLDLYLYDFKDSTSTKLVSGVFSAPAWGDDSALIFSMKSPANKYGSKYYDLYIYSLDYKNKAPKRLTYDKRLTSPSIDYNTNKIAAVGISDGTSNIYTSNFLPSDLDFISLDDKDKNDKLIFNKVTDYVDGEKIFSLSFLDNKILFDIVQEHGRDILSYDFESNMYTNLETDVWDQRDPVFNKDGSMIYASDKNGVYNIYHKTTDMETRNITNVIGGGFMPSLSNDGRVLYSLFEQGKYKIAIINHEDDNSELISLKSNYDYYTHRSMDYDNPPDISVKDYKQELSKPFIFPRLFFDYGTVKPGFYFYSTDPLDKYFIFGGASINNLKDLDLMLMFEYKKMKPTMYANLYWVTRNLSREDNLVSVTGDVFDNVKMRSDDTYIMFSSDIGSRIKLKKSTYSLTYNYSKYTVHLIGYTRLYHLETYTSYPFEGIYDYFRGHKLTFGYHWRLYKPQYAFNMLPQNGLEFTADISVEKNDFDPAFEISEEYGTLSLVFSEHNTERINLNLKRNFTLNKANRITINESWFIGLLTNRDVDDFFYFFGGGLPGVKGYTFYHEDLSGPEIFLMTQSIGTPIFLERNYKLIHLLIKDLSLNYIFQMGQAFSNPMKFSNGIEFRIKGSSFYSFPFALSLEYHKALFDNSEREPKFYAKLLFDFLN